MPEVPDDYEQQEGLQGQPEFMEQGEDPEVQQTLDDMRGGFHDREMNALEGMQEMGDYNAAEQEEMQPPMYAAEGMELPEEQPTFEGGAGEDTFNLGEPAPAATDLGAEGGFATEEELPPAVDDEDRFEAGGGMPR